MSTLPVSPVRAGDLPEQIAAAPRADGPCRYGEPHAWAHHHPANSPIWIPICQVCGVINGQEIADEVQQLADAAKAAPQPAEPPTGLDALRALLTAASTGPLTVSDPNEGSGHGPLWHIHNDAYVNPHLTEDEAEQGFGAIIELGGREHAELIVAAVNALPALLDLVDQIEPFGECRNDCDCGDHAGPRSCICHVTGAEARAWIEREQGYVETAERDRDEARAQVAALTAERDQERADVVAWLRRAALSARAVEEWAIAASFDISAATIERGEHRGEAAAGGAQEPAGEAATS